LVDDYTLYWSLPGVYNNRHHSTIYSGSLSGREYLGIWSLDWRLAAEDERIKSRALGDHARSSASGLFLPGVLAGSWKLNAGLKYSYFEDYDDELLPQAALEFFWGRGYGIRLSHSQSMRQPSYTELNYESPASLGNAGLDSQRAESTELRLAGKFAARGDWHTAVFHRTTHDMVDWVRETKQSLRWSAVNLDKVDTDGIECGASFAAESGHRASILYSFMHKSSQSDVYSSRYALDYPEHYLLLSGLWQICHGIGIELAQVYMRNQTIHCGEVLIMGLMDFWPFMLCRVTINGCS
jgi:iron complex outermembrane receptor protein